MRKYLIIIIVILLLPKTGYSQVCDNSITASIAYANEYATGNYTIFPRIGGTGNLNDLMRPIIIVEGFDYSGTYDCQDIYDMMNVDVMATRLASTLRNMGYDLIVLNFANGGDYIQKNAFLLVELINRVNKNKLSSGEDLVVVGYSMGGLVSRYALTYMEEKGIDHETRLFISYDSPQQGANMALGVQSLLMAIKAKVGALLSPEILDLYNELTCPAAKQLLIYHENGISGNPGRVKKLDEHLNFFEEIRGLNDCNGYPKMSRNVGITLGSGDANYQQKVDGDRMVAGGMALLLSWVYMAGSWASIGQSVFVTTIPSKNWPDCPDDFPDATYLSSFSGVLNDYYALFSDGQEAIDIVPGSYANIFEQISDGLANTISIGNYNSTLVAGNATMIPTVSALDLATDNYFYNVNSDPNILDMTPFEAIFHEFTNNSSHLAPARDPNEVQFILDQIRDYSPPVCYNLSNSKTLAGITVKGGEKVEERGVGSLTAKNYEINEGANVTFEATTSITLDPGFTVERNTDFFAQTYCAQKSCLISYNKSTLKSSKYKNKGTSETTLDGFIVPRYDAQSILNKIEEVEYELNNTTEAYIYPNPSHGKYYLELGDIGMVTHIKILDVFGKKLKDLDNDQSSIDISNAPNGIYLLKIETPKGIIIKKLIKN